MSRIYQAGKRLTPIFPQPDRDAVATFVDCVFRYADANSYVNLRAFNDTKRDAPPLFIEPIKVSASDFVDRVCNRIQQAAEQPEPYVFCPPVAAFGKTNGAAAEDLAEGLVLSVECDSNPRKARSKLTYVLGVEPTAVVASGGVWKDPDTGRLESKIHLHWRLVEPTRTPEEHERLREARALAADLVGADKTCTAIVHPLRWPGSWHRKNANNPRIARLKTNPDSEIELGEALERLREACPPKAHAIGNGHDRDEEGRDLHAPLPDLEAALSVMPNNETWDGWNRVGMATWVASNGQGFDAFDAWSKKSSKYDERATNLRWNHYYQSPPSRIGAGTIFMLASQVDPDWRSTIKTPEAPDWQKKAVEEANKALAEQEERQRIDALARKRRTEYDRERKAAAAALRVRTRTLDKEVEKRREELKVEDAPLLYPHWDVKPSEKAVDGAALLLDIVEQLERYVVLQPGQATVIALWIFFAWCHEVAVHSPLLLVTAPERDSGKSTLLGVVSYLSPRAMVCVGVNEATLFRSVDRWGPTLVSDEVDALFKDNEPLRAVYNSGWTRGTGVPRCVGDEHEVRVFSTFCPKVLGLKGKEIPDTTLSRAIVIEMKRKLPQEKVHEFAHADDETFAALRSRLARWAPDNKAALAKADPQTLPADFHNRVRANWKLVFAIGEAAGAGEAAAAAAKRIEAITKDKSLGLELLTDMKAAFNQRGNADIPTKVLIGYLIADEDRPWAAYGRKGEPITGKQIGRLLKPYGIISGDIYPSEGHSKGYKYSECRDTFERLV